MFGAEYKTYDSPYYGRNYHNHDVPCAVCMTYGRSRSLMIPGKSKLDLVICLQNDAYYRGVKVPSSTAI